MLEFDGTTTLSGAEAASIDDVADALHHLLHCMGPKEIIPGELSVSWEQCEAGWKLYVRLGAYSC